MIEQTRTLYQSPADDVLTAILAEVKAAQFRRHEFVLYRK